MNTPKRHIFKRFRPLMLLAIALLAYGQAATKATAENTFPIDGAGYEWNSVTWAPNPGSQRFISLSWKCEKCGRQHTSLTLSGEVDADYTNQRTGRRGSRRVIVWADVREKDTRELPDAMDVFLRRDGIRIDAIDTENTANGLRTLKSVYRENQQHQRQKSQPFVKNGLRYLFGVWKPGTLYVTTLKCNCSVCDHNGPPIQFFHGTIRSCWVEGTTAPYKGRKAWTGEELTGVRSFLSPKDVRKIPALEVLTARDKINTYTFDFENKSEILHTLRREWEKAHRD